MKAHSLLISDEGDGDPWWIDMLTSLTRRRLKEWQKVHRRDDPGEGAEAGAGSKENDESFPGVQAS